MAGIEINRQSSFSFELFSFLITIVLLKPDYYYYFLFLFMAHFLNSWETWQTTSSPDGTQLLGSSRCANWKSLQHMYELHKFHFVQTSYISVERICNHGKLLQSTYKPNSLMVGSWCAFIAYQDIERKCYDSLNMIMYKSFQYV